MGRNVTGSRRGFGWDAQNQRLNLYVNGKVCEYFDEPVGRTYYVNKDNGDDDNDGLSWGQAFDQIDAAIDAAEAYRATYTALAAPYEALRNRIVIQGSAVSAYDPVNSDLNFADVVGIGSPSMVGPGGVGAGCAMILNSSTTDAVSQTLVLGCTWWNVHFASDNATAIPFDATNLLLYKFEDCYFLNVGTNLTYGCLRTTSDTAGLILKHCHFGGDAGTPAYGVLIDSSIFNECCVEDCWGTGRTAAYHSGAYLQGGTVVRRNSFQGGTYGILDDSATTGGYGAPMYVDNRCYGSTAGMSVSSTDTCIGNYSNSAGTNALYHA